MKKIHLLWIIPIVLIFGILLGFYLAIPEKIVIDTGDNFKELLLLADNVTKSTNNICHNLTFNCTCDTYDMTELNKRYNAILAYQLDEVKDRCDEVSGSTWLCMNRQYCKFIENGFCDEVYNNWGENLNS